jgi:hypothetical protein
MMMMMMMMMMIIIIIEKQQQKLCYQNKLHSDIHRTNTEITSNSTKDLILPKNSYTM